MGVQWRSWCTTKPLLLCAARPRHLNRTFEAEVLSGAREDILVPDKVSRATCSSVVSLWRDSGTICKRVGSCPKEEGLGASPYGVLKPRPLQERYDRRVFQLMYNTLLADVETCSGNVAVVANIHSCQTASASSSSRPCSCQP